MLRWVDAEATRCPNCKEVLESEDVEHKEVTRECCARMAHKNRLRPGPKNTWKGKVTKFAVVCFTLQLLVFAYYFWSGIRIFTLVEEASSEGAQQYCALELRAPNSTCSLCREFLYAEGGRGDLGGYLCTDADSGCAARRGCGPGIKWVPSNCKDPNAAISVVRTTRLYLIGYGVLMGTFYTYVGVYLWMGGYNQLRGLIVFKKEHGSRVRVPSKFSFPFSLLSQILIVYAAFVTKVRPALQSGAFLCDRSSYVEMQYMSRALSEQGSSFGFALVVVLIGSLVVLAGTMVLLLASALCYSSSSHRLAAFIRIIVLIMMGVYGLLRIIGIGVYGWPSLLANGWLELVAVFDVCLSAVGDLYLFFHNMR